MYWCLCPMAFEKLKDYIIDTILVNFDNAIVHFWGVIPYTG